MKATIFFVYLCGLVACTHADKDKHHDLPAHQLSEWSYGPVLFGALQTSETMKNKVVIIEYWGTRCPPCLELLPHMAELYRRDRKKGLVVIGVESQGHTRAEIEPLVKKDKIEYTITSGAHGPIVFSAIPRAFVFDLKGALIFDGNPGEPGFEPTVRTALRDVKELTPSSEN